MPRVACRTHMPHATPQQTTAEAGTMSQEQQVKMSDALILCLIAMTDKVLKFMAGRGGASQGCAGYKRNVAELSSCRKLNSKIFIVVGQRQKQGGSRASADQTIEYSILFGAVEEQRQRHRQRRRQVGQRAGYGQVIYAAFANGNCFPYSAPLNRMKCYLCMHVAVTVSVCVSVCVSKYTICI